MEDGLGMKSFLIDKKNEFTVSFSSEMIKYSRLFGGELKPACNCFSIFLMDLYTYFYRILTSYSDSCCWANVLKESTIIPAFEQS